MPLYIIRQDITKINLLGGGGVDGAIHQAAGIQLLEECKTLGGCDTGDAKITKGYNLPCKYVIHTVGPIWRGGQNGEKLLLESCYKKSLALAKENGCETVAFPLISSGVYGYPKDKALSVAAQTISEFLFDNEMTVYIVVFDKTSYQISEELFDDVQEYIDDHYARRNANTRLLNKSRKLIRQANADICYCEREYLMPRGISLEDMLSEIDDNFAVKGITDVECYKKANVSKQTWYKIMNEKSYKPSKNTVIAFAIALELTLEETKHLLATVGFTLSKSSKFDIIIEYFLINGEYNIFTINETLFKFDQVCLGV